jgi:hypothetical protein
LQHPPFLVSPSKSTDELVFLLRLLSMFDANFCPLTGSPPGVALFLAKSSYLFITFNDSSLKAFSTLTLFFADVS